MIAKIEAISSHSGKKPINSNCRIGLLGGSFNPAHEGHLYISLMAMKLFKLHQVWWLVSPQNPLKSSEGMADYTTRFLKARVVAKHPRIIVCDYEKKYDLRYSFQTTKRLKAEFNRCKFVWIMGGDNLANFHRWKRWQKLADSLPIAVFDRDDFATTAKSHVAARIMKGYTQAGSKTARLAYRKAPCLTYIRIRKNPLSGTYLRNILGKNAFLG